MKAKESTSASGNVDNLKMNEDFYSILGVEKTSTLSQIKNSYRKLALRYHPDRNPGDHEAQEKFKKISIAYAVLSDPNKRRQYDLSGPSGAILDFEGIDISEMGGIGRMFGALFSKLGVPIPTQITSRVLAQAHELCMGSATDVTAKQLVPGLLVDGCIGKQEPAFFKLAIEEADSERGIFIICRSSSMSKFKLVLFDKEGGVRKIDESKKLHNFTTAEMYFVPFDRASMSELIPLKFYMEEKDVPYQFHLLDGLEPSGASRLEAHEHLFCVYGDNWIKDVKFSLQFLPSASDSSSVATIVETEKMLLDKKSEIAKFQQEYVEAKKNFDEAVKRLKNDTELIMNLLKTREKAYEEFIEISSTPFKPLNDTVTACQTQKGFFSFFG